MPVNGNTKPTRVLQLTDCHLFEAEDGKLLGLETQFSLNKVLHLVKEEQADYALVLATGDLAQDATEPAYQRFKNVIDQLDAPTYWLQGNHDDTAAMAKVVGDERFLSPCTIDLEDWRIIMLDSSVEGKVPGYLAQSQLDYLEMGLRQAGDKYVLVCLHHHPVKMECAWLDNQIVGNASDLFAILDRYPQVRAVIWGHVHQSYEDTRKGVKLLSTPSTCVQFKPKSTDFAADDLSPGYRWIDLYPDGHIETDVSRVAGVDFEVDYTIKGY